MKFNKVHIFLIVLFTVLLMVPPHAPAQNPFAQQQNILQEMQTSQQAADTSSSTTATSQDSSSIDLGLSEIASRYTRLTERGEIPISGDILARVLNEFSEIISGKNRTVQQLRQRLESHFSTISNTLNLVVALFIIGLLVFSYRYLKRYLISFRRYIGKKEVLALTTLGYAVEIFLRVLPTLFATFGIWILALILDMPAEINNTIFEIAAAIVLYKFARWFLEILFAPDGEEHGLIPCEPQVGKYFFYVTRALLQWTLLYTIVLFSAQFLQLHSDVINLIQFIYRGAALVVFIMLFARRDFTLSLFPHTENKFYRNLYLIFEQIYYPAYFVLIVAGLISILGYVRLSNFIYSRVFYTIGIILGGILIHRIISDGLNRLIPAEKRESEQEEDKAAQFWNRLFSASQVVQSTGIILLSGILIAKAWWLLGEQGIWQSITSLLTFRIFAVQDVPITIWSLIKALLIFGLFLYFSRLIRRFLKSSVLEKTQLDIGARHAILTVTHYIVLVVGVVVALESVGIQLTSLTVFAGALGLGIGFGLQNIANNFASGLIILFERPIKNKDFVQVGDILGTVTRISARSTTILTRDNIAIIVPNSDFIEKTVVNWSLDNTPTRVHVPIGVEYGTDPERVRDILLEIAKEHSRILAYPRPRVWFKEFGDSSLDFELLAWINDPQEGVNNISSDINFRIHKKFQETGIGIPFPQRDVHLKIDKQEDIEIVRKIMQDKDTPK